MSRQTNTLIRKAIAQLRDAGPEERLKILDRIRPFLKELDFRKISEQVSTVNAAEDLKKLADRRSETESEAVSAMIVAKNKKERQETQVALMFAAIFQPPEENEKISIEMDPDEIINQGPRPRWAM